MTGLWAAKRFQAAAMLLCALALVLRLFAPSGWMPVAGPAGITLQLCNAQFDSGATAKARALLADAFPGEPQSPDDGDDQPCAFATVAHAAITPYEPAAEAPAPALAATPLVATASLTPGRGLAAPPPPATGPPLLA